MQQLEKYIFLTKIPLHILSLGREEAWKQIKDLVRSCLNGHGYPSNPCEVQVYYWGASCRMYNKKWAEPAYGELQNKFFKGTKLQAWLFNKLPTGMERVNGPQDPHTGDMIPFLSTAYLEAEDAPNKGHLMHRSEAGLWPAAMGISRQPTQDSHWQHNLVAGVGSGGPPHGLFVSEPYITENSSLHFELWGSPLEFSRRSSISTASSTHDSINSSACTRSSTSSFTPGGHDPFYGACYRLRPQPTSPLLLAANRRRLPARCRENTFPATSPTFCRPRTIDSSIEFRNLPIKTGRGDLRGLLARDMQLGNNAYKLIAMEGPRSKNWRAEFSYASRARELTKRLDGIKIGQGWLDLIHGNVFCYRVGDGLIKKCEPAPSKQNAPIIIDGSVLD